MNLLRRTFRTCLGLVCPVFTPSREKVYLPLLIPNDFTPYSNH